MVRGAVLVVEELARLSRGVRVVVVHVEALVFDGVFEGITELRQLGEGATPKGDRFDRPEDQIRASLPDVEL